MKWQRSLLKGIKNFTEKIFASPTPYSRFKMIPNKGLYDVLGYPKVIMYSDYENRYTRQDIAQRVIRAPVDVTWRFAPEVYDSKNENSKFEIEWAEIVKKTKLFSRLKKVDILSRIGSYAVLFIGFSGDSKLSNPPAPGAKVLYLTPITEPKAKIESFDNNPESERCGLPEYYRIETSSTNNEKTVYHVHWSRVIHVAQNTLENDVYGIPELKPIYNRLIGLEKLAGGSPEMYWQGAKPGYVVYVESLLTEVQKQELDKEISDYINGLTRWLRMSEGKVEALAPQVSTPIDHVEVQLKLISSATQIPLRILVGSEKGELASGQDERAWNSFIDTRRQHIAEDVILKPLIDRLIEAQAVSAPEEYAIKWKPIDVSSAKERAEIGRIISEALNKYTSSVSGMSILPPEQWLRIATNMSEEEIERVMGANEEYLIEEDRERSNPDNKPVKEEKDEENNI